MTAFKVCKSSASTIRIEGRKIFLNGQIFHAKGVNWNPVPIGRDHPPTDEDFKEYASIDAPLMSEAGTYSYPPYLSFTVVTAGSFPMSNFSSHIEV